MTKKLGEYFELIPYRNWSLSLIALNVLAVVGVFLLRNNIPPVVPLYYGKPYGDDQLAEQAFLALPSVMALLICLANIAIINFLKDGFLKKVLLGGMVVATLFALITITKIVFLVGNI